MGTKMRTLVIAVMTGALVVPALAHWTGPTPSNSPSTGVRPDAAPDKAWWDSLQAPGDGVPCCDIADGQKVEDVDWDTQRGPRGNLHYRVRLNGQWIVVPDGAVVSMPNRFGPAVVWPYRDGDRTKIRCFMPGAGA